MKHVRKMIEIDEKLCTGCGECVPACEEGAIQIVDGKAKLIADKYCDGLGACLGECPTGALQIVEREADSFDEQAVADHLKTLRPPQPVSGCPSAAARSFAGAACPGTPMSTPGAAPVTLSHWPIQIRLIPPNAPFLQGADLLVAADCVPVAYPGFNPGLLEGKVVMLGCPKFDDIEMYEQQFADIFASNDIRSVTVAVMEVPCCQGLPVAVQNGMQTAGKHVPLEKVVVSLQGEVLDQIAMAS